MSPFLLISIIVHFSKFSVQQVCKYFIYKNITGIMHSKELPASLVRSMNKQSSSALLLFIPLGVFLYLTHVYTGYFNVCCFFIGIFILPIVTTVQINRRIAAFQQRKREELNLLNIQEFCTLSGAVVSQNSCARTSAVVLRSNGSRSHLKCKFNFFVL